MNPQTDVSSATGFFFLVCKKIVTTRRTLERAAGRRQASAPEEEAYRLRSCGKSRAVKDHPRLKRQAGSAGPSATRAPPQLLLAPSGALCGPATMKPPSRG